MTTVDIESMPVATLLVDRVAVRAANREACRLLGCDLDWLVGRDFVDIVDENDAEMLDIALNGGVIDRLVVHLVAELGGTSVEVQLGETELDGRVATLRDVTELLSARRRAEELQAELRHLATHDALTGLPNRALLRDRLEQAQRRANRFGFRFGVLFCDLDGFKAINDRYGHEAGDAVLIETARRLEHVLGEHGGTVARFGGDEFVIVREGDDDERALGTFASRLIESIIAPVEFDDTRLYVGTSVGIAIPTPDGTIDTLLAAADAAMYAAKSRGKGCWEFSASDASVEEAAA
jgi:diguanylate cyclase (GGDEF)-like protein